MGHGDATIWVEEVAWLTFYKEEENIYQWEEYGDQKGEKKMWGQEWAKNFIICVSFHKLISSGKLILNIFIIYNTHWNFWDDVPVSLIFIESSLYTLCKVSYSPYFIPCFWRHFHLQDEETEMQKGWLGFFMPHCVQITHLCGKILYKSCVLRIWKICKLGGFVFFKLCFIF